MVTGILFFFFWFVGLKAQLFLIPSLMVTGVKSVIHHTPSVAELPIIDPSKLARGDDAELERLFDAGKTHGFFYLDLTTAETPRLVDTLNAVLAFMAEYFDQPREAKMKDNRKSDIHGYEPCGTSAGATEDRTDHYESLKISFQECRTRSDNLAPASNAHGLTMLILRCLTKVLGEKLPTPLESFHDPSRPTTSTLSMFRYPSQIGEEAAKGVGHNKHTVIGTLTFLLCQQWGLQVLSPQQNKWVYVAPKHGHAIIVVGDSLRFLTQNRLLSTVHRVLLFINRQLDHRYSISFFLRPADDTIYRDSKGRMITAREWHDQKFDHFRVSHSEQAGDSILTGGMEQADKINASVLVGGE
ncbi:hypothetical protein BDV09DRAFT_189855 [Aspergillus tetrazonus]